MSNLIYVFTKDGFKNIDDIRQVKKPRVYAVNSDALTATPTVVDHWETIYPNYVYCFRNRDNNFRIWFTDQHNVIAFVDHTLGVYSGKQLFDYYTGGSTIGFPTRFNVNNQSTKARVDNRVVTQNAYHNRLSTSLLYGNQSDLAQFLYTWRTRYGSYYATDYNRALMLQGLVTGIGYCSYTIRSNGFKIVEYTRGEISVDQVSTTSPKVINRIPIDMNGNKLHLIYNIDQSTIIL